MAALLSGQIHILNQVDPKVAKLLPSAPGVPIQSGSGRGHYGADRPGQDLFFEPRLSRGHNISCNTRNNLGTGGAGPSRVSLGHRWQPGGRTRQPC